MSNERNVKSNHDAPLNIAGVTVAAGKTVGIDINALRGCLNSNGIKTWIKLGLIEIEGLDELTGEATVDDADAKAKADADAKAKADADAKAKADADAAAKPAVKLPGQN